MSLFRQYWIARGTKEFAPRIIHILQMNYRCAVDSIDDVCEMFFGRKIYDYKAVLDNIRKLFDDLNDSISGKGSASSIK